jgi:FKBP-type peptidyl-prolyl cis-trans isomerase FklB
MRFVPATLICLTFLSTASFAAYGPPDESSANVSVQAEQNKKAGEEFLKNNKTKAGVVNLQSGLQYKVLKEGTGPIPTDSSTVVVNYEGKLLNGTIFDSSYQRGESASFPVTGVIAGWTEALKLMKKGSIWELYIPSNLAYGEQGSPSAIGPNETLIFKVELLDVQ